jgi:MYXO-CTERM domain-containing protein
VPQAADYAIGAGQPLSFENVVVGPPQSPAFHVFFDLVLAQGAQPLDAPLFTLTLRGNVAQVPAPPGAVLVLLGLGGLLVRRASRRPAGAR